jgi:hypothetical protein
LAYQPPDNSTFLSEQTSHQQPASRTFLSEQISTSHQPNEQSISLLPTQNIQKKNGDLGNKSGVLVFVANTCQIGSNVVYYF